VIEIKEGIELDRAIAGVIGLICTQRVLGTDIEYYAVPRDGTHAVHREFKPSTNLNDAFYAAEAVANDFYGSVELPPCITVDNRTGWRCTIEDSPEGRGRTPALAICAAILKVKTLESS